MTSSLITTQLRHYFQASKAVHGADDVTTGHLSEHLWSPSLQSYLIQQAGVPNLILLTLKLFS